MKDVAKETGEVFKDIGSTMKDSAQTRDKTYTESKQTIKSDKNLFDSQSTSSSTGKSLTKLPHFDKLNVNSVLTVIITQGSEE